MEKRTKPGRREGVRKGGRERKGVGECSKEGGREGRREGGKEACNPSSPGASRLEGLHRDGGREGGREATYL